MTPSPTYKAFWRPYVRSHRHVARLLGGRVIHAEWPGHRADVMLGWGRKRAGMKALHAAEASGRPWLLAEDGFLRSIGLGPDEAGLSIVVDDIGIYYDATTPSRFEALAATPYDAAQRQRGQALAAAWRAARVSKYNLAREAPPPLQGDYVLAVDQTAADSSITYGSAEARSFHRMLEAALDEHPNARVVLKVHPDVIAGRKQGHFGALTPGQAGRVVVLADNAHPPGLIEPARAVYVVTSQMGFEALLWQRPVRCFGMPFYAGWGLTRDELAPPPRRRPIEMPALVHAALIDYARYLDPETLQRCEPERLLDWMGLQRRQRERHPAQLHLLGFRDWKRPVARAFFGGSTLVFADAAHPPPPDAALALWGRTPPPEGARGPALRVEDGFLRSVGLGAHLVHPVSWVTDKSGMYYDATGPSDLETLLASTRFDGALLARAAALRERIAREGLTKYNVGSGGWRRPAGASRVVLVPGQVEDDASIALGAIGAARSNLQLLQAARERTAGAWLVYKPHPDVLARQRAAGHDDAALRSHCDEVVTDVPMRVLLDRVDEVHTLTSLTGFEALLRGKRVVCHGAPFYAGWGLTEDLVELPRRGRRLSLDELVAGALILYPTYVSRSSGRYTTPERAIDELLAWRERSTGATAALARLARPLVNRWVAWRGR